MIMLVRECLHKSPVTVPPQCTLKEAAGLMRDHRVGALLVVGGGELVGIVTDRDLAVHGTAQGLAPDEPVDGVMTKTPTTIQGSEDLFTAFTVLRRAGVRRLPVLEDAEVAGIITVDDLLVWLVGELAAVATPVAGSVLSGPR
jgi:CBS domain-containing protein